MLSIQVFSCCHDQTTINLAGFACCNFFVLFFIWIWERRIRYFLLTPIVGQISYQFRCMLGHGTWCVAIEKNYLASWYFCVAILLWIWSWMLHIIYILMIIKPLGGLSRSERKTIHRHAESYSSAVLCTYGIGWEWEFFCMFSHVGQLRVE